MKRILTFLTVIAFAASSANAIAQTTKATAKYNKFDFVAGDNIIFEDLQAGEKLGEFPSQWDLVEGEVEIVDVGGQNAIVMYESSYIRPLMKDMFNNLGEVFTIEFDYYQFMQQDEEDYGELSLHILSPSVKEFHMMDDMLRLSFRNYYESFCYHQEEYSDSDSRTDFIYSWTSTRGDLLDGNNHTLDLGTDRWVHISLSFNKRALKIYVDETRIANIPNMKNECGWLGLSYTYSDNKFPAYIRNIRIAQGAVPLYDRMMSDGKFITYGITFDINKSTIKEESMGEINRVVKLMTDNPDLKFSVEGHTDNTGNASHNQTLSEARSKAIVDKLVSMGISADRLSSTGKGQNNPIADNATEEGRAKNRRVEFVKQ